MNIRLLIPWLALGLFAAGGCATEPKVVTDFNPSAAFSEYRTFAFSGMTDRGREVGASDLSPLRGRLKEMVDDQLIAKGLRRVNLEDRPDLLVHLFFGVKEMQQVQSYGPYGTTYEYHDGDWVKARRSVTVQEDHEGALIVNLTESSKKELVWRAVIRAMLGNNLENNFELADKGITMAFKDYPPPK